MRTIAVSGAITLDPVPIQIVGIDARSGAFTITFPNADGYESQLLLLKVVAGSHNITLAPQGTDTINNAVTLNGTTTAVIYASDGSGKWHLFESF